MNILHIWLWEPIGGCDAEFGTFTLRAFYILYHKQFYINYLIQYLLLYKVIDFFAVLFCGVLFGDGLLVCFVSIASALFYVYACMYCLYVCLCRCLYVILCMLVYAGCEGAGSFAGGCPSLAVWLYMWMPYA